MVLFEASTNGGGKCSAIVPDVCKTPSAGGPVPLPYQNDGQVAQTIKTCSNVKIVGRNVVNIMSKIPMSEKDERGVLGGIVSNVVMHQVLWSEGSSQVRAEGNECEFHMACTCHNGPNSNTSGIQVDSSQSRVKVAR